MTFDISNDFLIPLRSGHSVSRGWTSATGNKPMGVTWHWSATWDLSTLDRILGGLNAQKKGSASAHYGVGRSFEEGVHRYVTIENRSWHAGINQTLRWDGKKRILQKDKASRTTIGIETVNIGYERINVTSGNSWIECSSPS